MEILKIGIEGNKHGFNKNTDFIETTSIAIKKFYPLFKIEKEKMVKLAILNCSSDEGNNSDYRHLFPLVKVCAENCKNILLETFEEELDRSFSIEMYESLLINSGYDSKKKKYFNIYSEAINKAKQHRQFLHGKLLLTDSIFYYFTYIVYKLNIDFNRSELKLLTNLNDFETWLINPIEFDYNKFNAKWLVDINNNIFFKRLKNITKITIALDLELSNFYEPVLAEIRYKHFSN